MPLTPRQLEVLDFIVQFIQEHRYAPTLREMADQFDLSRVTVLQHLEALEEKGYLERQSNKTRGISVKKQVRIPSDTAEATPQRIQENRSGDAYNVQEEAADKPQSVQKALPVYGYLTGDQTVKTTDTIRYLTGDELLFGREDCYLLEVRSDLLQDEHIIEGDYLVVDEGASREPNDIVVLRKNADEMFVERYSAEKETEEMFPVLDGDRSKPQEKRDQWNLGVVKGVIRTLN